MESAMNKDGTVTAHEMARVKALWMLVDNARDEDGPALLLLLHTQLCFQEFSTLWLEERIE
jgi:hypothetical protein